VFRVSRDTSRSLALVAGIPLESIFPSENLITGHLYSGPFIHRALERAVLKFRNKESIRGIKRDERGGGEGSKHRESASSRCREAAALLASLLKYGLLVVIYNVKFVEFNRGRSHSTPPLPPLPERDSARAVKWSAMVWRCAESNANYSKTGIPSRNSEETRT